MNQNRLNKENLIECAFGTTPDISAFLQFSFYEPIYYLDTAVMFSHSMEIPEWILGLATNVGDLLTY